MLATAVVSAVLAWGAPSAAAPPAPACPEPAPCGCDGAPIDLAPRAAAEPPPAPAPPTAPPATGEAKPGGWYGGPAIVTDALSLALILGGGSANNGSVFYLGVAGFALGAPINHLAHGEPTRALGSLGLRALAGGAGGFILLADVLVNHCDNDVEKCRSPGVAVAEASVVVAAAMIVDDAFLARTPAPTPARETFASRLNPGVLVGPGLAFASLGGRF
jgi:hypothetical protein